MIRINARKAYRYFTVDDVLWLIREHNLPNAMDKVETIPQLV